jgi:parvulin-like peptidyl-prolyl isomerase
MTPCRFAAALALAAVTSAHAQTSTQIQARTDLQVQSEALLLSRKSLADSAKIIEASNQAITKGDFEKLFKADPRFELGQTRLDVMSAMGSEIGKAFAMEAEARRRGIDQLPEVQLRIRNYATQLLADELLKSLRTSYAKDEALMGSYYEKTKAQYAQPTVRHILVRFKGSPVALRKGNADLSVEQARARAEALRTRLAGGADFAALAKTESDDTGSAQNGGLIGVLSRGSAAAAFEDAAYTLPVGELSKVIRTEYGFHILRVDQRQPMKLDAVRSVMANDLAHKEMETILLNGYKLNAGYFGTTK